MGCVSHKIVCSERKVPQDIEELSERVSFYSQTCGDDWKGKKKNFDVAKGLKIALSESVRISIETWVRILVTQITVLRNNQALARVPH